MGEWQDEDFIRNVENFDQISRMQFWLCGLHNNMFGLSCVGV